MSYDQYVRMALCADMDDTDGPAMIAVYCHNCDDVIRFRKVEDHIEWHIIVRSEKQALQDR